jgi:hypothetical protein
VIPRAAMWNAVVLLVRAQHEVERNEVERRPRSEIQAVRLYKIRRLRDFTLRRERGGETRELLILGDELRYFEASNLKDKVCAVLGMASDGSDFLVDYNKTLREVFLDVARYSAINNPYGRQLDFLGDCNAEKWKIYIPASLIARLE